MAIPLGPFATIGLVVLLTLGWLGCGHPLGSPPKERPISATPKWYAQNGPLLAEYLKTLSLEQMGQPLKGIRLSGEAGGPRWLEGQIYLGIPSDLPDGVSGRLVQDGTRTLAYLWVSDEVSGFSLEPCEDGEQQGIRARQAGGAPYAWNELISAHGVVYTACPPRAWLPEESPISGASNAPPPPP